eukprot:jgi/Mesen1/4287/ME000022S03576
MEELFQILSHQVFTSEGELVSGDDSMEKHVAMVPVGPEKQLQEEACFHVIVPHVFPHFDKP